MELVVHGPGPDAELARSPDGSDRAGKGMCLLGLRVYSDDLVADLLGADEPGARR
jgi:hypothetical protein